MMKLRSIVKTPQFPLLDFSHRNASTIHKHTAAGRQVRAENSQRADTKSSSTFSVHQSKRSIYNKKTALVEKHSKNNSVQPSKGNKIKHSAAKKIVKVKRAGRGKKSQHKNIKLASTNVLTNLDSIFSPTVVKNSRSKVEKAVRNVKQKAGDLSRVKPTSTSISSPEDVSRNNLSFFSGINSHKIRKEAAISKLPNPLLKRGQSVASFLGERQSMENPDLYSDVTSVNRTSDFTTIVSRNSLFEETKTQVKSSDTIQTSFASFRFERSEKKQRNDSKLLKLSSPVSQTENHVAPAGYISSRKSLRSTSISESNKITTSESWNLKKSTVVKDNVTENEIRQPGIANAGSYTRYVLLNKVTNKPDKRKASQKSQVKIARANRIIDKKQTQLLTKKENNSGAVRRNIKSLCSSRKKLPQSSKKHIQHTASVTKKSKSRGDLYNKKTALVEITGKNCKKSLSMVAKTSPVNKVSSSPTLKSLQTGKEKQMASHTKAIAKESVIRKRRKLPSRDYLPQNKSSQTVELYAPLLEVELTPIQSLIKATPKSVTSSPIIVSSVFAAKQNTLPQSKKKTDLTHRRSLSLRVLASGDVSRQSYSSKFTSTPKLASSLERIEKASSSSKRKSVKIKRQKKSAIKHAKKKIHKLPVAAAKIKKFSNNKAATGVPVSNNQETVTQRKIIGVTGAVYSGTDASMVSAPHHKKSAKKKNYTVLYSLASEATQPHFTVGKNLDKVTSKIKARIQSLPVTAKAVNTKSSKLQKRFQNNNAIMPPRKNQRNSNPLKKDTKLAPIRKQKPISYVVKKHQSRQKIKPESKPYLNRTSNRPLRSPENILSLAAEDTSIQNSHKHSEKSPQIKKQSKLLQKRRNMKAYSSLSSSSKGQNVSLSNIITSAESVDKFILRSIKAPSSRRKNVLNVLVSQKKTSRLSEDGKIRNPVTHAKNVKGFSNRKTEDNIELMNSSLLSQAKHSNKSVSSVLNRSKQESSRTKKSLVSLKTRRSLFPGEVVVKKPALRGTGTTELSPAVTVKKAVKRTKDSKSSRLGVKLQARQPVSLKKVSGKFRTVIDTKLNLTNSKRKKVLKAKSRQKVPEVLKLQKLPDLPKEKKQRKTLFPKKSGKLSTKVDTGKSITRITSLVKAADDQENTTTPRQTETSKPVTLKKVHKTLSSPSQKKISTRSSKKVTEVVVSKMSEKSPKLLSKGGVKKAKWKKPGKVTKAKKMNWLTLEQNKTIQVLPSKTPTQQARYIATSDSLTATPQLPQIVKGGKPVALSLKRTRSAKTTDNKKTGLVSPGEKKSQKPSYIIQKTISSTSVKKRGKKKPYKVADNVLLNKNSSELSKQTNARKLVSSAKRTSVDEKTEFEKTDLVSPRQKKAPEFTSQGSFQIPRTKSSILGKKKDKKLPNKINNSDKILSDKVSSDKVKRRKSNLSVQKMKKDTKAPEIDKSYFFLPVQNEESELSPSGYKGQKMKSSSAQKKVEKKKKSQKVLQKQLSRSPKPVITRISATTLPDISRVTKVKQITKYSSEQADTLKPLLDRYKTEKTSNFSSSKKTGTKKKKIISVTDKVLSYNESPKISTRVNRRKYISVSPKVTRIRRSRDVKTVLLASLGNKEALKLSPKGNKAHKTKLSAVPKEGKKTQKQIPSKIHSGKVNSKVINVKIDASTSSTTEGRGNKRKANLSICSVSPGQKQKSKQLSGRQKNKVMRLTDVPTSASFGTISDELVYSRRGKSSDSTSNVSFKKTEKVHTVNKSFEKSKPSRSISTVRPFNYVNDIAINETTPSMQFKRRRETSLMASGTIYARQAQNIPSSSREATKELPELQHVDLGLGRRSLFSSDSTDGNYSPQINKTSVESIVTLPLDIDTVGSYERKEQMSPFPDVTRAESYIYNVSYTRTEDQLPVKKATKLQQATPKNVRYSEQSTKMSKSKVSFSSSVGTSDDHTRYIPSTPFPVQGRSAVSSEYTNSAGDSGLNVETVSSIQPLISYMHHVRTDSRSSDEGTPQMTSKKDSDEESAAGSYTKERYNVKTEEKNVYINRKVEENEEFEESTDISDLYLEETEKDENKSFSQNSHSKQCTIS